MTETNQDKYELLLQEFIEQRNAIKSMILDLEKVKVRIDTLLPDSLDKRFLRIFEEKVKTMTELFRVILDMRKEIIKNAKDEIELRKRFIGNDDDEFDISIFNVKKIADRIEKLSKDKKLIEQKTDLLPTVDVTSEINDKIEKENK